MESLNYPDLHTTSWSDSPKIPMNERPPQKEIAEKKIDWTQRHVEKNPAWHDKEKGSRALASIFASIATVFSGLAVGSLFVPLPPVVTIPSAVICGTIALAFGIASIILFCNKEYWNDPSFVREKGIEAEKEIREKNLSYPEILKNFDKRIWDPEWKTHDLNILLSHDVQTLSFEVFLAKHGPAACGLLNAEHRQVLFPSFADWMVIHNLGTEEIKSTYPAIARNFQMDAHTKRVLTLQHMDQWIAGTLSYGNLIQKDGSEYASNLQTDDFTLRRDLILEAIRRDAPGYNRYLTEYQSIHQGIQTTPDEILNVLVRPELQKFFEGKMTYLTLRDRNQPSIFSSLTSNEQLALQNDARPRSEFLNQSFGTMISEDCSADRLFFEISEDDIRMRVVTDLRTFAYPRFHAKHGTLPYQRPIFSQDDLDVGHQNLSHYLEGKAYPEILSYRDAANLLQISFQEQQGWLRNDFETMSLPKMVQKHGAKLFYDPLLMSQDYTQKWHQSFHRLIADTHSLTDLADKQLVSAFPPEKKCPYSFGYHSLWKGHVLRNWQKIFLQKRDDTLTLFRDKKRVPKKIAEDIEQTRQKFSKIDEEFQFYQKHEEWECRKIIRELTNQKDRDLQNIPTRDQSVLKQRMEEVEIRMAQLAPSTLEQDRRELQRLKHEKARTEIEIGTREREIEMQRRSIQDRCDLAKRQIEENSRLRIQLLLHSRDQKRSSTISQIWC